MNVVNKEFITKVWQESTISSETVNKLCDKSENLKPRKHVIEFIRPEGDPLLQDFVPDKVESDLQKQCFERCVAKNSFAEFKVNRGERKLQKFEEYRTCFKCGECGHLVAQCP